MSLSFPVFNLSVPQHDPIHLLIIHLQWTLGRATWLKLQPQNHQLRRRRIHTTWPDHRQGMPFGILRPRRQWGKALTCLLLLVCQIWMDRHWRVSIRIVLWLLTPDLIQRHTLTLHSLSLMLSNAGMFQLDQLHATLPYRISAKTDSALTPVVLRLSRFISWPIVLFSIGIFHHSYACSRPRLELI